MSRFFIERPSLKTKILELAKQAKYIVEINRISKDKSLTLFPNRIFGVPLAHSEELVHEVSKLKDGWVVKRIDKNETKRYILPDYAIRPFILQDIIIKCYLLGIDISLCVAYDEHHNEVAGLDAVPGPDIVDNEKQKQVLPLYNQLEIKADVYSKIKKLGIEKGVSAIDSYVKRLVEKFVNQE